MDLAIPRPERSKVPSCNSYAGLYLIAPSLTAGEGPGYCIFNCKLLRIELVKRISASETTWELELALEWVVEGADEVGGASGICDNEEISRAGLGNVLYVEPKEVYLDIKISLLVF